MLVANAAQSPDPLQGGGDETAFPLQRLHDNGSYIFGRAGVFKDFAELADVVGYGSFLGHPLGAAVDIGEFGPVDSIRKGSHTPGIGFFRGHRHGKQGAPVEGTGEDDDIGAARKGTGHLDSVLIGLGTAIGKKGAAPCALDGSDGTQFFGQLYIAVMGDDIEHAVEIFAGLLLHRSGYLRVAMADVQDADTTYPVQEAVAVRIFDDGTGRPLHDHRITAGDGIGHSRTAPGKQSSGLGSGQDRGDDSGQFVF